MARYDLSEAEWRLIEALLPNKPRGVARVDDRRVINGIFYVLRTGSPWRDLPSRYGPSTTIYNRYNRWAKAGVWLRVFEALAATSPQSLHLIDSSIIRAHQHAAGGKKGGPDHAIGRSRGGLSTKINVLVNQDGLPLRIVLSAGQASDKAAVEALIDGLPPAQALVADRGYDAQAILDLVRDRGGCAHIPTQRDRKIQRSVDPTLYRQRNQVERFFCKLKHFRRIATRFDKLARNFLAAILLASTRLWLKSYESTT
ncbi:IS5 family transposase [Roseomonas sp. OT10]|uniref:IS5 family transposase n=1 Tax=Roseomonas cutis TaxID=2897332 RepID=UPI001E476112|nr:IS5 family transposase [Roseomonas sp. OT10]UFN46857.1 IS5 family transposase [Roseomonas sp. OT10]UFN49955.1 IS5 family transposase [Roseomonas sp. OT10]UFN50502.1 IS5 family transposase [Roseomonas sp. OT10]